MRKFFKYSLLTVLLLCCIGIGFLFLTPKGYDLRITFAEMLLSSQHPHWAKYTFLPQETLDEILENIRNPVYENTIVEEKPPKKTEEVIEEEPIEEKKLTITIETIEKRINPGYFYKGKIVEISDPKNVKLVTSSQKNHGEQIFVQAKRVGALVATNASGYIDINGVGNGGTPTGIVIEDSIAKTTTKSAHFVAALTKDGQLLTGKYTAQQLLDLDVQYAAGFKPQLIANGKKLVKGDGGWGIGPRTAIGQKEDGTIVIVVIDGRQPTRSIGATIEEVQNILYERGVINAICMDGGSSSSMYFNGENITIPSSVGHIPRYLPNIWAVIPEEGEEYDVIVDGKMLTPEEIKR